MADTTTEAATEEAPAQPALGPLCIDACGRRVSAHAARYKGAVRCKACANKRKAGTFNRDAARRAAETRWRGR